MSDRLNSPLAAEELERRWSAIRAAMEAAGIDVLLAQNNNDFHGGTVKYLTDLPAVSGIWTTVVFPRDEQMTIVTLGPIGGEPDPGGSLAGVARIRTAATFAAAAYTSRYDAELTIEALRPWARGTIGVVGRNQMSAAMLEAVRSAVPDARFVDATDLLDGIRVIKSELEQELIRRTAALQDEAMRVALAAVEPGKKESDITAIAQHVCLDHGAEQGIYLSASWPPGEPVGIAPRHFQNRVLREGDALCLLIESNGPGGFYTELGRTCVLGQVPAALVEELDFVREAQRFCLDLLKPGTPSAEIWERYNAFLAEHGRPQERRLHAHGQGHDLVERPLIRFDEPMAVQEGMSVVVHPSYIMAGLTSWICDNYLIGPHGPGPSIHAFPQEIVQL
ncbi:MAG TPA: M24 family metallopeptidase [Solirubrobacteraceae bacterium]|nr:M24 family metallopeptidase [Solirubrobacteraceae bacterium]